jgi:hypothetical protein
LWEYVDHAAAMPHLLGVAVDGPGPSDEAWPGIRICADSARRRECSRCVWMLSGWRGDACPALHGRRCSHDLVGVAPAADRSDCYRWPLNWENAALIPPRNECPNAV